MTTATNESGELLVDTKRAEKTVERIIRRRGRRLREVMPKVRALESKPIQAGPYNAVYAQYLADRQDGHLADDAISMFTGALPCNWGTPPHSHSEMGFLLSALWPMLELEDRFSRAMGQASILDHLIRHIPNFPVHRSGEGFDYDFTGDHKYLFFSSTSRKYFGGKNGTRFVMQQDLLDKPERWDLYADRKSPGRLWTSFLLALQINGLAYDWIGIWGGYSLPILGRIINDPTKWYCSEAVHFLDQFRRVRISPRHWGRKMIDLNYVYLGNGAALKNWNGN